MEILFTLFSDKYLNFHLWDCSEYLSFSTGFVYFINNFEGIYLSSLPIIGRKILTNLDSILKSRYISLPTKVCVVMAMVFPVVKYECESWTIKTPERRRIDAFELWCWRRLLGVPWTARKFNQFILKISPGCSLEGLMLKLKLQYFGHLM